MQSQKNRRAFSRFAVFLFAVSSFFFGPQVFAQSRVYTESFDTLFQQWSVRVIGLVAAAATLLLGYVIMKKDETERQKQVIFWSIVTMVAGATLFVAGTTIYINVTSDTGGPVHWHADYKVIACGQELDLVNPKGLSNKIGTPTLHEHNDNRIHVEGVLHRLIDGSLGKYFNVIGGELSAETLKYPLADGSTAAFKNGDQCPDGSEGQVQVFVNKVDDNVIRQTKLEHPEDYVLSGHERVPPGDCILVEFGTPKAATEASCRFHDIAVQNGELIYEFAE